LLIRRPPPTSALFPYTTLFRSLLGIPRAELIGKCDHDFFPREEADFFIAKDRAVLNGGTLVDIPEEPIATRHHGERILHTKKVRSEEHTSELQSRFDLVCRLLL